MTADRVPTATPHRVVAWAGLAAAAGSAVAAYLLELDVPAALPLALAGPVGVAAWHAYDRLLARHVALQRLYDYRPVTAEDHDEDGVLRHVLAQAKQLLRAERAELTWVVVGGSGAAVRTVLDGQDRFRRSEERSDPGEPPAESLLARTAALLPRGATGTAARRYLDFHGLRDAVVVPLRLLDGVAGMITVADRPTDVATFDQADVTLLATVAASAGAALATERALEALRYAANHDLLTGLPHRAEAEQVAAERLASCARGEITGFAVLALELDNFKELNDTLGHEHGDSLLREVAGRLRETAGAGAVVARLNGVGFTVVLPATPDRQTAVTRGLALLAAVRLPVPLDGLEVEVGVSVGAALAPEHGSDVATLFACAEQALHAAKAAGDGVRMYAPAHAAYPVEPGLPGLVDELQLAIERDQLIVYVQPKARLDTGQVTAVEALVRWNHPSRGLLLPGDFLPLAETAGLLGALSSSMLRLSVAAVARWQGAGLDISVAVNLSGRDLSGSDLPREIAALLKRAGVAPRLLTLEVTEASVMSDPDNAVVVLRKLRRMGVRLAVDDFGTGYSSLSHLQRLPVHEVKIDRSFVMGMATDPDAATVVRSIVALGANLSLDVVAEGVEDEASWQELARLGCTGAQGYHLSRPMPVPDLVGWLSAYSPEGPSRGVPRPRGPLLLRRSTAGA